MKFLKNYLFLSSLIIFVLSQFYSCNLTDVDAVTQSNTTAELTVEMLYYDTDSVHCKYNDGTGWKAHKMEKLSNKKFKHTFTATNFEIQQFMHGSNPQGSYTDYNSLISFAGIRYCKVNVNGYEIDKRYIVSNSDSWVNLYLKLDNNGKPKLPQTPIEINDDLSPEAPNVLERTEPHFNEYRSIATHIHGWLVALHNNHDARSNQTSTVEVKNIKVFQKINGNYHQMGTTYYYTPGSEFVDGGLYVRFPFFPNDYHVNMPATINSSGVLSFHPSDDKLRVWHWWHEPRQLINANATDFKIEAEVKITGPVSVQPGLDFQTATNQVGECVAGNWYYEKRDPSTNQIVWQTLTSESHNGR